MSSEMPRLLVCGGLFIGLFAGIDHAAADAERGRIISQQWCSACHLVGPDQVRAIDGVATFEEIAQRHDVTADGLRAFLASPHPVMPDMALTRDEIRDIVAYIQSMR
jgi:mono/diheme cytochrome c family protein